MFFLKSSRFLERLHPWAQRFPRRHSHAFSRAPVSCPGPRQFHAGRHVPVGKGFWPFQKTNPGTTSIFFQRVKFWSTWNPKQPFINGCFNWMIPNLYIGNGCFTKHPFINGCLGFQEPFMSTLNLGAQVWKFWNLAEAKGFSLKRRETWFVLTHMGVSKNNGTPKSSILIGFSIINHPFWGTPYFWKHPYRFERGVDVTKDWRLSNDTQLVKRVWVWLNLNGGFPHRSRSTAAIFPGWSWYGESTLGPPVSSDQVNSCHSSKTIKAHGRTY